MFGAHSAMLSEMATDSPTPSDWDNMDTYSIAFLEGISIAQNNAPLRWLIVSEHIFIYAKKNNTKLGAWK